MSESDPTFIGLQRLNDQIYREANERVYPRTADFFMKIARYASLTCEKGIEKGNRKLTIHYSVMTLSWAMAFANRSVSLDVTQTLWTHYDRCPYCTGMSCECKPGKKPLRKTFFVQSPPPTVAAFVLRIAAIYPQNTLSRAGVHLAAEANELQEALADWERAPFDDVQSLNVRLHLLEEYSDVCAHLAAIAHTGEFDLGREYLRIFADGCPGCGKLKCRCGYVNTANSVILKK